MPKLTLLGGVAGSGKSTWVKVHAQEKPVVELDSSMRGIQGMDLSLEKKIQMAQDRAGHIIMQFLKEGKDIIYDAPNLNKYTRRSLMKKVGKYTNDIEGVWLEASYVSGLERLKGKEWAVAPENYMLFLVLSQPMEESEGIQKIVCQNNMPLPVSHKVLNAEWEEIQWANECYTNLEGGSYLKRAKEFKKAQKAPTEAWNLMVYADVCVLLWEYFQGVNLHLGPVSAKEFSRRFFERIYRGRFPKNGGQEVFWNLALERDEDESWGPASISLLLKFS